MNKVSFIHTHYLPNRLIEEVDVETSIVALEVYPDLQLKYYGDFYISNSIEDLISWHNEKKFIKNIRFSIENISLLKNLFTLENIKEKGLVSIQLFHSRSNSYFDKKKGLTELGYQLLTALVDNDLILDLSHLNDYEISSILRKYCGRIMVSHCVCDELVEKKVPRTNTISKKTIDILSEKGCVFGIPFVNDLVTNVSHDPTETDDEIMNGIISQILFFAKYVGVENVALGPDYMDTEYFSKVYKQTLKIPNELYSSSGFRFFIDCLRENHFSEDDIYMIMSGNVKRIIM